MEFSQNLSDFAALLDTDSILDFAYVSCATGWYRVRAVDIWGRASPFSAPAFYCCA